MMERWKAINGYDGIYEISDRGRVRGKHGILKAWEHNGKQPYYVVGLSKNGKSHNYLVHRLVAESFIENPMNKEQVNHIDGNVHNNCVLNLEWVTNSENTQHAYDHFLNKRNQLHIEYNGETHGLRKWCKILNLPYKRVWWRYSNGWPIERCFENGGDVKCQG